MDYRGIRKDAVPLDQSMGTGEGYSCDGSGVKQAAIEDKRAAVHMEMKRMNQLPPNSAYAAHRRRVLNKLLQLMSIQTDALDSLTVVAPALKLCASNWQRTSSQDEELELLFSSLSI